MQMFTEALNAFMMETANADIPAFRTEQVEKSVKHGGHDQGTLAILDGGATSLMAGRDVVVSYLKELQSKGVDLSDILVFPCERPFRFADNKVMNATACIYLPVYFKGRKGKIGTYIVPGATPLLFPRPLMELFSVVIDFTQKQVPWDGKQFEPAPTIRQGHCAIEMQEDAVSRQGRRRRLRVRADRHERGHDERHPDPALLGDSMVA